MFKNIIILNVIGALLNTTLANAFDIILRIRNPFGRTDGAPHHGLAGGRDLLEEKKRIIPELHPSVCVFPSDGEKNFS